MNKGHTEINGKFYQESNVVMLPTEKASIGSLMKCIKKMPLDDATEVGIITLNKNWRVAETGGNEYWQPQNLHFLCDEEIKEGDYHYNSDNNTIAQAKISLGIKAPKVIATTDSELWTKTPIDGAEGHFLNKPLPRPSNSFIDKFLSEYNANRKIERVLVEMNREFEYEASAGKSYSFSLKVAPDNTTVIKPVVINKLEQLAVLLEKAGVRKYLNINGFGYSQIERDIVQLFE